MLINPNNLSSLAGNLYEVLKTPVSIKLLEILTEKQRNFLVVLINKWSLGQEVNGKSAEQIIKEILDSARAKIKPKYVSPKAEAYLKIKKIYD